MPSWRIKALAVLGMLAASPCGATPPAEPPLPLPSALCHDAAAEASRETGVPLRVLLAITLTETGRPHDGRMIPWPWTLNIEGDGYWFESRDDALARAEHARAAGRVSFDTGCFQVNYRWHGDGFESLADMLDPVRNAVYAARFLERLFAETGNWSEAAGAYHSRTARHAKRYRAVFERHFAALDGVKPPTMSVRHDDGRENGFRLLQPGGKARTPASLVPRQSGTGGFFARARPLWEN